jgi:hypothetical protein
MLITHILTALITLGSCVYAWYKPSLSIQKILNIFTILSLVSGEYVAFDHNLLNRATCMKLGVYLLMIGATQYMLHAKLKVTANEQT